MTDRRVDRRTRSSPVTAVLYSLLLVASFEIYHLISARAPRRVGLAHQHALLLIDLERRLGLLMEPGAQRALIGPGAPLAHFLRHAASTIYSGGQIPWLALTLCWLYLFDRPHFRSICFVAIVASLAGILFAGMYPVAPPRFALAGAPYGIQDITGIPGSERVLVLSAGFNPFASFPSIHVLWACFSGFGLWVGAPRSAPRWAALAFPLIVTLAVVLTGNHYVLDCLASFLLFGCFLAVYWWLTRAAAGNAVDAGRQHSELPVMSWARMMRHPALLAGLVGILLVCANAGLGRLPGIAVLLAAFAAVVVANSRVGSAVRLPARASLFDWYAGLLLVAGATTAVTADGYARAAGSALWLLAAALSFCGRLRMPPVRIWLRTRGARPCAGLDAQGLRASLGSQPLPQLVDPYGPTRSFE